MSVLSDRWIKKMSKETGMIKPFVSKQIRKGKISFGLSSYGYDARVSNEFKIFTDVDSALVDPKNFKNNRSAKFNNKKIPKRLSFFRGSCYEFRF